MQPLVGGAIALAAAAWAIAWAPAARRTRKVEVPTAIERDEILVLDRPRLIRRRSLGPLQAIETFELVGNGRRTTLAYPFESVEAYGNALLGVALFAPLLNRLRVRDRRAARARLNQLLETPVEG